MRASGPDTVTRSNQDVSTQVTLFCIIYTNYNLKKWLAGVKKPVIPWDKFKGKWFLRRKETKKIGFWYVNALK